MQPARSFSSPPLNEALRERLHSYHLTDREEQIVGLVLEGLSNRAIGQSCSITEQTVKDHLKHIYRKMGVGRRTALIAALLRFPPTVIGKPAAQDRGEEVRAGAHRSRPPDDEGAD